MAERSVVRCAGLCFALALALGMLLPRAAVADPAAADSVAADSVAARAGAAAALIDSLVNPAAVVPARKAFAPT